MKKTISRRDFMKAALASSALYTLGAGASPATAAVSGDVSSGGPFDVAIIGAGAAGVGAGLILQGARTKPSFVILEARDRIGGRTFTDTTSFPGIAWDQGAQWLHQVTPKSDAFLFPTNNPLFNIAVTRRIPVFPDLNPRILRNPPTNLLDSPVFPVFTAVALDILGAGAEASTSPSLDISAAEATAELQNETWYDLVWGLIQTAFGAGLDEISSLDFFNLSALSRAGTGFLPPLVPSLDNWLIPSGYGALVTSLAGGLPIKIGTLVRRIDWGTKQGVTLDTSAGTVRAKAVIVTVPLGTLTGGAKQPIFGPSLPTRYLHALDVVKMGHVEKIALLFAPDYVFDVPQDNTFVMPFIDQREEPFAQTRAFGHKNFAILLIGGKQVIDLERHGELVDYALEQIVLMFGTRASAAFRKGVASSWISDPLSLGSFSYALPHGVPGREQLLQPLAGQIFFAGEAASIGSHSQAHGAFISGGQAAKKALKAIA